MSWLIFGFSSVTDIFSAKHFFVCCSDHIRMFQDECDEFMPVKHYS